MVYLPLTVIELSVLSDEPIRISVYSDSNGVEVNPTSMVVKMAFKVDGTDPDKTVPSDWTTGVWDVGESYKAQCNPPCAALGKGAFDIYLWLAGSNSPVRKVGVLKVI